MPDSPNQRRLSDVLLERYLAGDLSDERRIEVERSLENHPESAERLAVLEKGREEFLLADRPDQFAHRIIAKVELGRVMEGPSKGFSWSRFVKSLGLPSVAMAAVALIVVTISDDLTDSSPLEEAVRLEKALEGPVASKDKALKRAKQKVLIKREGDLAQNNEQLFDESKKESLGTVDVESGKEMKMRISARKSSAPPPLPPKPVMAKRELAEPTKGSPASSSAGALFKSASVEEAAVEIGAVPAAAIEPQGEGRMDEDAMVPVESSGGARLIPSVSSKSFLMSSRSRAPKDLSLTVVKKRKGGPRTATSRNVSGGIEISFLSPSNYYFLVVKREGNQVRSLSGSSSKKGHRGRNQIVLPIANSPQGLGADTFVVTSTLAFDISDIKLLNKLPRLDQNWTGTLKILHAIPSPK